MREEREELKNEPVHEEVTMAQYSLFSQLKCSQNEKGPQGL